MFIIEKIISLVCRSADEINAGPERANARLASLKGHELLAPENRDMVRSVLERMVPENVRNGTEAIINIDQLFESHQFLFTLNGQQKRLTGKYIAKHVGVTERSILNKMIKVFDHFDVPHSLVPEQEKLPTFVISEFQSAREEIRKVLEDAFPEDLRNDRAINLETEFWTKKFLFIIDGQQKTLTGKYIAKRIVPQCGVIKNKLIAVFDHFGIRHSLTPVNEKIGRDELLSPLNREEIRRAFEKVYPQNVRSGEVRLKNILDDFWLRTFDFVIDDEVRSLTGAYICGYLEIKSRSIFNNMVLLFNMYGVEHSLQLEEEPVHGIEKKELLDEKNRAEIRRVFEEAFPEDIRMGRTPIGDLDSLFRAKWFVFTIDGHEKARKGRSIGSIISPQLRMSMNQLIAVLEWLDIPHALQMVPEGAPPLSPEELMAEENREEIRRVFMTAFSEDMRAGKTPIMPIKTIFIRKQFVFNIDGQQKGLLGMYIAKNVGAKDKSMYNNLITIFDWLQIPHSLKKEKESDIFVMTKKDVLDEKNRTEIKRVLEDAYPREVRMGKGKIDSSFRDRGFEFKVDGEKKFLIGRTLCNHLGVEKGRITDALIDVFDLFGVEHALVKTGIEDIPENHVRSVKFTGEKAELRGGKGRKAGALTDFEKSLVLINKAAQEAGVTVPFFEDTTKDLSNLSRPVQGMRMPKKVQTLTEEQSIEATAELGWRCIYTVSKGFGETVRSTVKHTRSKRVRSEEYVPRNKQITPEKAEKAFMEQLRYFDGAFKEQVLQAYAEFKKAPESVDAWLKFFLVFGPAKEEYQRRKYAAERTAVIRSKALGKFFDSSFEYDGSRKKKNAYTKARKYWTALMFNTWYETEDSEEQKSLKLGRTLKRFFDLLGDLDIGLLQKVVAESEKMYMPVN